MAAASQAAFAVRLCLLIISCRCSASKVHQHTLACCKAQQTLKVRGSSCCKLFTVLCTERQPAPSPLYTATFGLLEAIGDKHPNIVKRLQACL
jgi:hypothetical protein